MLRGGGGDGVAVVMSPQTSGCTGVSEKNLDNRSNAVYIAASSQRHFANPHIIPER